MKKQAFLTLALMATTLLATAAPSAFAATQSAPTSQGVHCAGTTKTVVEIVNGNGKVTYYNNKFSNGFTAPTTPTVWTVKVNNTTFKATFLSENPGQLWLSIPTVVRILNAFGDHATYNGKTIHATSKLSKLVNQPVGVPNTYPNVLINNKTASYGMATKQYKNETYINLYSAAAPIMGDCDILTVPNMTTKTFVAHLPESNHYTGFYTSNGQPITN